MAQDGIKVVVIPVLDPTVGKASGGIWAED